MKCYKCGAEISGYLGYCNVCGANLNNAPKAEEEDVFEAYGKKKKKIRMPSKKILIGAGCVLAAVAVVIGISSIVRNASKPKIDDWAVVWSFYHPDSESTMFFYEGSKLDEELEGNVSISSRSDNNNVLAILTEEDELWLMNKKKMTSVAEDVIGAEVSGDGKTLVYLNDDDEVYAAPVSKPAKQEMIGEDISQFDFTEDGKYLIVIGDDDDYALYAVPTSNLGKRIDIADDVTEFNLYDAKYLLYTDDDDTLYRISLDNLKKEPEEIGENILSFEVSPDGKTMAFSLYDDGDYKTVVRMGSKEYELEEFQVYAVSNGGKVIYGENEKGAFGTYNLKKEEFNKLKGSVEAYIFNDDNTDVLFSADGKYYLSVDGKEAASLGKYSSIYPMGAWDNFIGTQMRFQDKDGEYGVGYIKKSGKGYEMVELISGIGSYGIYTPDDGKTFYYEENDKLYVAKKSKDYKDEKLASDIYNFELCDGGKKIVCLTNDEELFTIQGGKEFELGEDVSSFRTTDKDVIWFLGDYDDGEGTLFYSKNGKKAIEVDAEGADEVVRFYVNGAYVMYLTNEDTVDGYTVYDIYVSKNGKGFKCIAEEVCY